MKSKEIAPTPIALESEDKTEEKPKKELTLLQKILAKNKNKKVQKSVPKIETIAAIPEEPVVAIAKPKIHLKMKAKVLPEKVTALVVSNFADQVKEPEPVAAPTVVAQ